MLKLPSNYRVRRNWRGKLILQKKVKVIRWVYDLQAEGEAWIDCDWSDVCSCECTHS